MTRFAELRALPLLEMDEAAWREYYPAMGAYLADPDPDTRHSAVERLVTAIFWAEESAERQARKNGQGWDIHPQARFAWLRDALEAAHHTCGDVMPAFLKRLSVKGDDWVLMQPLRVWLEMMLAKPPPGVDPSQVQAALLRIQSTGDETPEDRARLIALLDHPSSLVRAEAAHSLSDFDEDLIALFALIKEKEIRRPGVAGPFWSEFHMDWSASPIDPVPWMLDILEQRYGPEPSLDEMGYNGIDFYLHELCSLSPEAVQRMMKSGHLDLALETACEMRCLVAGMEPVLLALGFNADARIAKRARLQLALFYRVLHPAISDGSIQHWPDWSDDAEGFSVHWGDSNALWLVVLYPNAAGQFDNATAWALIDRALPPDLRGKTVRHPLHWKKDDPPGAFDLTTSRMVQFESGAALTLDGDVESERWHRIEIGGAKLGETWKPFSR